MKNTINVTKSSMPSFEEYANEIKELWDTRWLTNMGKKHNQLEKELEVYLDAKNVSLTVNGHMALELAIQALGVKGEIITSPFTFASTTHAIIRCGSKPVFCDINKDNYTIDVEQIESLITNDTVAIIPIHVYGNICNIEEIEKIARKYNLRVIYDAAHAFGEKYKNNGIMNYGDISIMSFHATKVFHTIEGGALSYKDNILKNKIELLRDFGIKDEETVELVGTNAKMNEFCAAMGLCNLRHIDDEIKKRKKVVELYREILFDVPGISLKKEEKNCESNYAYFPILIDEKKYGHTRDEMQEYLKEKNVYSRKYFYPLTNQYSCIKEKRYVGKTPIAEYVAERVLSLPLFADMTEKEVKMICEVFYERRYI